MRGRPHTESMKGHRTFLSVTPVVVTTVSVLLCVAVWAAAWKVRNAACFKVTRVISSEPGFVEPAHLKGRNIFSLDLRKEAKVMADSFPGYRKVRIVRIFPDRLYVDFARRRPLAYVKLHRYFCVDEEGVLFDLPGELEDPELPIITGLESRLAGAKAGMRGSVKELALAVDIAKAARSVRILQEHKVRRIDVPTAGNASFFLDGGLEIKVGPEDLKRKMELLNMLLYQPKNELDRIKYIDLRFKEPAIKLKDA